MLPSHWLLVKCAQIIFNDIFFIVNFSELFAKIKKSHSFVIQLYAITNTYLKVKKSDYVLTMHLPKGLTKPNKK